MNEKTTNHKNINRADFKATALAKQIERDHSEAIHSAKLGKSLVKKTVRLVENGESKKPLTSPRLYFGKAEVGSTTLALNAELKAQGIGVTAEVTKDWNGSVGDPIDTHNLRIVAIESEPIATLETQEAPANIPKKA